MMPSNQSVFVLFFFKLLFGKCVEFSSLKGPFDFVEIKIKLGVKIRSGLIGNTIFSVWK